MRIHGRNVTALAGIAAVAMLITARADDETAQTLLQRVIDAAPKTPFVAKMRLSSTSRGWTRELQLSHKHLDKEEGSFMEVTGPQDVKDTRFLLLDRSDGSSVQYIYVPAARRAIQISAETRKQQFLGSDFYVYDLAKPNLENYTHSFVGEEVIGGRHCRLIQSVAKNPENELYSKTVTAVDPADLVIVRTQFFDAKGKLFKVWTNEKLEKVDGVWTPMRQRMSNVQDNTDSLLEITEIRYNADVPDEMFTKGYLTR
jgi:outer membrane lipoprotein-sorting protein